MDFRTIRNKKHYVFDDEQEFRRFFLDKGEEPPKLVKDWRQGEQGDWIQADDGGIVQILRRGTWTNPSNRKNWREDDGWLRTIVGTFTISKKTEMDTDFTLHPDRYRLGGATAKEVKRRWKTRTKPTKQEVAFAMGIAAGNTIQRAYENAYGPKVHWKQKAFALLKQERVMTMLNRNIDEVAEKLGVTYEFIMGSLKELAEDADADQVRLGALKELADWLGAKERDRHTIKGTLSIRDPFGETELASIEAERTKTLAEVEDAEVVHGDEDDQ